MAAKFTRPQGTEDVTPKDIYKWRTVENLTSDIAESYGYREIRIPTFENSELFHRSVGETTDVVQKEMYTVKARETEFTLRPEGTAGTIRALIQNGLLNEALPQKVYYKLSCFRHERPQAGRLREFHQFGVEMAGSAGPESDADIIALGRDILMNAGVTDIELHLNSIGCPTCRKEYHTALKAFFEPHRAELCDTCQTRLDKNPMRLLDCKSPICHNIGLDAPLITDYLCEDCKTHFETLQKYLTNMGIDFVLDPRIVRGLDYYTKTVFEFITTSIGAQGTVCAGGRYDGLIEQLGGKPTPAMGFGMGLERLLLTMEAQGADFGEAPSCVLYVANTDVDSTMLAQKLVANLRAEGFEAQYDMMSRGIKAQMKYANKLGAQFVMVLGSNEMQSGMAKIKNMETGDEQEISLNPEEFVENFLNIAEDTLMGLPGGDEQAQFLQDFQQLMNKYTDGGIE